MAQKKTKGVSGTLEWADMNVNCSKGCSHNCLYCYSKAMAVRTGRATTSSWSKEHPYLDMAEKKCTRKESTQFMFPSSHDITPNIISTCLDTMQLMFDGGHSLLVVSKPHLSCIKTICKKFPVKQYGDRILFRFTIGSADDAILSLWEPGAPSYKERIDCLKYAFSNGYQTSVSSEPMLDDNIEQVIADAYNYVTDCIWVGKANRLIATLSLNGFKEGSAEYKKGKELQAIQTDEKLQQLPVRLKKWKDKIKWKHEVNQAIKKKNASNDTTKKAGGVDMLKIIENPIEKKKPSNSKKQESVQAVHQTDVILPELEAIMKRQEEKKGLKPVNLEEAQLIYDIEKQGKTYEESHKYIKAHINIVMQVAEHLHYVCNYKLYRLHYNTVQEYAKAEFDYSKGRVYHLTRAHELAEYINSEIKKQVLTTEPQCRELLKLKVYKDFETEDEEKSKKKRLEVVRKICNKNKVVTTGLIAEAVAKEMAKINDKRAEDRPIDKYSKDMLTSVKQVSNKLQNVYDARTWTSKEKSEIKQAVITELEALLTELKK